MSAWNCFVALRGPHVCLFLGLLPWAVAADWPLCPEPSARQPGGPCEPYFDYPKSWAPTDNALETYFRINTTQELPPAFRKQWGWLGFPLPAQIGLFWPWNGTLYDNGFYSMPRVFKLAGREFLVMSPVEGFECLLGAILLIPLSARTYRGASWRDVLWNILAQSFAMAHFVSHCILHVYNPHPTSHGLPTQLTLKGLDTFIVFALSFVFLMRLCMLRISWVALVATEVVFSVMRDHGEGKVFVTIIDRFSWMFITAIAMYRRDVNTPKHWSTWGAFLGSFLFAFGIGRAWFLSAVYGDLYLPAYRHGDRWWIPHHIFQDAGQVMAMLSVLHLPRQPTAQLRNEDKDKGQ